MKIIGVGKNYADHVKEMAGNPDDVPVIFLKPDTALLRNNDDFYFPEFTKEIHHEIELVIKIHKEGKYVDEKFAHKYYDEIALGIDFTARDIQAKAKEKGQPWTIAKGFNHSAPISKFLPIKDFNDKINFHLDINGKTVQKGNSEQMIWNVNKIIAYVSQFISFKKGDLIYTGTPSGVGPITVGDRLEGYLENKKMLDFEVK